jgi:hypothetical protein
MILVEGVASNPALLRVQVYFKPAPDYQCASQH